MSVRKLARLLALIMGTTAILGAVSAAWTASPDAMVEGAVATVEMDRITVNPAVGTPVQVQITPTTRIIARQLSKFEEIRFGDFIGVAAKKESNGSLAAVSINIFPPELRGQIREGKFPMATGNTMTNAVVTEFVSRVEGRTVTLRYADNTVVIVVPAQAEIHRLVLITLSDVRTGMRATVRGSRNADGSIAAAAITVESSGP